MGTNEKPIYGVWRIAEHLGVSEDTVRRWIREDPSFGFVAVGSYDNTGGSYGKARWSMPSSLQAHMAGHKAKVSQANRRSAQARWQPQPLIRKP